MHKNLTAIFAAWLLIAPALLHAQNTCTLKGKITSADGKPLEGAAVYLNRAADSALVKVSLADTAGNYSFVQVPKGQYRLTVNLTGYQPYKTTTVILANDTTINTITLVQSSSALKTVTVTAQKPMVEHLIDRTVVNADAFVTAAGGTAMDLLEKAPGVMVDQSGAISLQGKSGVTIYIDDKPTYLSGDDLASYIRSLPSSSIDRIELMANPPAKYDAAGNAGIINIRTKRIKEKGFNGSLNLSAAQGKYARSNNNLVINYRRNKLNIGASLAYNNNTNFNSVTLNRYFDQSITSLSPNFGQNSFAKRQSQNYSARVTADYYATDKTTLGMLVSGLVTPSNSHTASTSLLMDAQNKLDSTIIANNHDSRRFENGSINFNYRHAYDKKGTEHTIDLDYITYHTQINQQFINNSYYPDGTLYDSTLETGNLPATIHIFSAKTDYSHPLRNGVVLSAGLKSSYTQTDNIANYFNVISNAAEPDYDKTNHFIYKENINAAYINANKEVKRLQLQAGLRFENTNANGHQLGNAVKPDSSFSRNYNGIFPTFYVQYKLDSAGKQLLAFNYGRRVDRPYYASLNPFLSPTDKFTYNAGNPFLLPTYANNYELSYTYKNITTTLFYNYMKDKSDGLVQIINGYYYNRPGNLDNTYVKGIEVDAGFNLFKWLTIQLYARYMQQHTVSAFYTGPLDTKGSQFFTRPVLTFKPGNDWTIQVDGLYRGKLPTEQFIDAERHVVNVAVAKKFKSGISLRLVVNDVFYTLNNAWQISHLAGTQANFYSVADSRNLVLSFSYRFGQAIKNQRKHDANGAQSEKERAGN